MPVAAPEIASVLIEDIAKDMDDASNVLPTFFECIVQAEKYEMIMHNLLWFAARHRVRTISDFLVCIGGEATDLGSHGTISIARIPFTIMNLKKFTVLGKLAQRVVDIAQYQGCCVCTERNRYTFFFVTWNCKCCATCFCDMVISHRELQYKYNLFLDTVVFCKKDNEEKTFEQVIKDHLYFTTTMKMRRRCVNMELPSSRLTNEETDLLDGTRNADPCLYLYRRSDIFSLLPRLRVFSGEREEEDMVLRFGDSIKYYGLNKTSNVKVQFAVKNGEEDIWRAVNEAQ
jgi:hypothetical protein